jgi:hypothetical protein
MRLLDKLQLLLNVSEIPQLAEIGCIFLCLPHGIMEWWNIGRLIFKESLIFIVSMSTLIFPEALTA